MRAIQKQVSGSYHLQKSHARPPQTPKEATSRWSDFGHKAKDMVMQSLLDEQYHLCCYSELRADQEDLGYHIEHVENKKQNPARTFDYTNLAASALKSDDLGVFKARGDEVFGGHTCGKGGTNGPVDMAHFISPHQSDCHQFFAYLSDGRIVPAIGLDNASQNRAQYTIDTLNLNSPFLITRRQQWWNELDQLYLEHIEKGWILSHLATVILVPTYNKLNRFFSLTRQFFGQHAEQALQDSAPNLL